MRLIAFIAILFSINARANLGIELQVRSPNITLDDELALEIIVKGTRSLDSVPEIENIENFKMSNQGSSSSMNIINGSVSVTKSFSYSGYPEEVGSFTIGPAKITVNGEELVSNIIKVKVSKQNDADSSNEKNYFLKSSTDIESPYVGQQFNYIFKLYRKVRMSLLKAELPKFENFLKESLGDEVEYEETINGVQYRVTELKYALFADKPGVFEVPGAEIIADVETSDGKRRRRNDRFESFFNSRFNQTKRVRIKSKGINIKVRPLPTPPKDFSGLVGQFVLKTDIPSENVKTGDSTTITYTLKGVGNVKGAKLEMPDLDGVKIYEDKPQVKTGIQNDYIIGIKTFKFALVPANAGLLTLPTLRLNYFDPIDEKYSVLTSKEGSLSVLQGEDETLNKVSKSSGEAIGNKNRKRKILEVQNDLMDVKRDGFNSINLAMLNLIKFIPLILFLLYGVVLLILKRKNFLDSNEDIVLKKKAFSSFKDALNHSNDALSMAKAFRDYLGAKFSFDSSSLTSADIDGIFSTKLSSDIKSDIVQFFKDCDMAQYSGGALKGTNDSNKNALIDLVKRIEKESK